MTEPVLAGVYEHYKGGLYLVMGVACDADDGRVRVVYVALTDGHLPGLPLRTSVLETFFKIVTWPDGTQKARYQLNADQGHEKASTHGQGTYRVRKWS